MSLTAALNTAKTGLGASAIQADTIARNVANAKVDGYTRKTAELVTVAGGGVTVAGTSRRVDDMLQSLDRSSVSRLAAERTASEAMTAYTDHLGQPNDETSPAAAISRLKEAMITLSAGASDASAQSSVLNAASDMAQTLRNLSGVIREISGDVDAEITHDVSELNTALKEIAEVNRLIAKEAGETTLKADYRDRIENALQTVSGLVDIRTSVNSRGMVDVFTGGGVELVRGNMTATVSWSQATGELRAGDVPMTPGTQDRSFSGGTLYALFGMRQETIPNWSRDLDTMAAALVEGTGRAAPINGGPGLFTDAGGAYDPAAIDGLASRIRVNAAADPAQGGDLSVIRNGGDATLPEGDNSFVDSMLALFDQETQIAGRPFGTGESLLDMAASIVGAHQKARAQADGAATRAATAAATISASRQNFQGVDVDDELQHLMLVQQNYAANAKLLTAVSEMMDVLLQAV